MKEVYMIDGIVYIHDPIKDGIYGNAGEHTKPDDRVKSEDSGDNDEQGGEGTSKRTSEY